MEDEQVKARIGANIAYYRKQAGLTQVGLAEKLNYSDKAVSKWENGTSDPSTSNLIALAKLFDLSAEELLHEVR